MTRDYRKDPGAISRLTAQQLRVTQDGATEPPFRNEYWDNKEPGIYVDIVSGEPLFASASKYDSHTGWPSFTVPLEPDNIVERTDTSDAVFGTEVRSAHGDSHLGHVFTDGPVQAGGLRYCMNSAAMRFIPAADLETEGYGQYRRLFDAPPTEAQE
jgi:peptide-methionine (R)-S-oxide reductase